MLRVVKPARFRNVLAVFPHPDDETISCGASLRCFADAGARVTLVLLTGGERGNPSGVPDPALKAARRREVDAVARILRLRTVIHGDFQDGRLADQRDEASAYLAAIIERLSPDLIITHDPAGIDGHRDHIACSDLVTELRRTRFRNVSLWYATLPPALLTFLTITGQMSKNADLTSRRVRPTHQLVVGLRVLARMRALRAYRSQRNAIGKGLGRFVAPWLMVGGQVVEYFAEVG